MIPGLLVNGTISSAVERPLLAQSRHYIYGFLVSGERPLYPRKRTLISRLSLSELDVCFRPKVDIRDMDVTGDLVLCSMPPSHGGLVGELIATNSNNQRMDTTNSFY